jgi:hypothetical protein
LKSGSPALQLIQHRARAGSLRETVAIQRRLVEIAAEGHLGILDPGDQHAQAGQQRPHLIDRHPVLADRIQVEIGGNAPGLRSITSMVARQNSSVRGPSLSSFAALRDGQLDKVDQLLFKAVTAASIAAKRLESMVREIRFWDIPGKLQVNDIRLKDNKRGAARL